MVAQRWGGRLVKPSFRLVVWVLRWRRRRLEAATRCAFDCQKSLELDRIIVALEALGG